MDATFLARVTSRGWSARRIEWYVAERVSVDLSGLVDGKAERLCAPGSTVKVYGVPVELKFRAMGFLH